MVSPFGGNPTLRTAHFLKPSFPQTLLSPLPNSTTPTTKPIYPILKFSSKVHFHGWKNPLKNWNSWVEKMCVLHEQTWRKASIYDAIMASKLEIPRCYQSLFVLAEKWCPETSSFILPWGEVSITLEDVMVLGGYSLTGDSIFTELCDKKMLEVEEKLLIERSKMFRTSHRKASQTQWVEKWMDKGDEMEHEAFLSLWLSRYVLPADDFCTVNKNVLTIAVLLAKGTKLALAPPILASIYRDLRLLKEKIATFRGILGEGDCKDVVVLKLKAPLQLFQAWIWERFLALSPEPKCITDGLRLERWNKVKILKNDGVSEAVDFEGGNFRWRPYSTPLNNWCFCAKMYPEKSEWVSVSFGIGFDIESYARCVRTSELVGFESSCVEQYLPHRVSMQFGLDQDIPCVLPCLSDKKMIAWNDYNRPIMNVKLYVPSKHFESDVTMKYREWWKKINIKKEKFSCPTSMDNVKPTSNSLQEGTRLTEMLRFKKEINEGNVPPGFDPIGKRAALDNLFNPPGTKRSKGSPCHVSSGSNDADTSFHSTLPTKGVQAEDDPDDHRTLSQLFRSKCKRANRSTCPAIDIDGPLSSEGDNESLQEVNARETEFTMEDKTASDTGTPIPSPIKSNKGEVRASSCCVPESSEMDLLDRIARLQRIVDTVIAAKRA